MSATIFSAQQQTVLERMGEPAHSNSFYLAGETALALELCHRRSANVHFFRPQRFDPGELVRRLDPTADSRVRPAETDTLTIELEGVMLSFFSYPYPLLRPPKPSRWSVALAAIEDIAAMKLSAIAVRGSRKDFVDLYFVYREATSLDEVVRLLERKFGGGPLRKIPSPKEPDVLRRCRVRGDARDAPPRGLARDRGVFQEGSRQVLSLGLGTGRPVPAGGTGQSLNPGALRAGLARKVAFC